MYHALIIFMLTYASSLLAEAAYLMDSFVSGESVSYKPFLEKKDKS